MKLQKQLTALATIDHAEWFFWSMHEYASETQWKANSEQKEKAVTILKSEYGYTDDDIREGIQFLHKLASQIKTAKKP